MLFFLYTDAWTHLSATILSSRSRREVRSAWRGLRPSWSATFCIEIYVNSPVYRCCWRVGYLWRHHVLVHSTPHKVRWVKGLWGPVFSYKLRYVAGFWLVEIAISTNQKPAIYRNVYQNTGPGRKGLYKQTIICKNRCSYNGMGSTEVHINV